MEVYAMSAVEATRSSAKLSSMSRAATIAVSGGFLLVLAGLAATDAALTANTRALPSLQEPDDAVIGDTSLPPIRRKPGPDVIAVATAHDFSAVTGDEATLLERVLPAAFPVNKRVLLQDNDRASSLAWIESGQVRDIFTNVKKELRQSFSANVKDLIDERQTERGKPPRDVLSFVDPAIHTDRVLIVRVRQRLYEFHITAGKEPAIDRLIDALTD
jgi:hypothetical protein